MCVEWASRPCVWNHPLELRPTGTPSWPTPTSSPWLSLPGSIHPVKSPKATTVHAHILQTLWALEGLICDTGNSHLHRYSYLSHVMHRRNSTSLSRQRCFDTLDLLRLECHCADTFMEPFTTFGDTAHGNTLLSCVMRTSTDVRMEAPCEYARYHPD
jgi:hypothetical protein